MSLEQKQAYNRLVESGYYPAYDGRGVLWTGERHNSWYVNKDGSFCRETPDDFYCGEFCVDEDDAKIISAAYGG